MVEERLDRLESEKKDLEQELKKQRNALDEQVAQVQAALEKLEKSAHRTGADIGVQMEQVQNDLSQLRGQVEQYQHRIEEIQAALDKVKGPPTTAASPGDTGDKKPDQASAKKPDATDKPDKPEKPDKPDKPEKAAEKPTDRKGLAQFAEKSLADDPAAGRKLAEEWFKKYPKPDSNADQKAWAAQAARVHYVLGSSLMAQKDWRNALAEFGDIVKNYGKSDEAADALLKSADCFAALKMNEESRLALEEILNSYPKSQAAAQAKTKLADLKKAKPAPGKKK
jgi:TolA-binding protein